MRIKVIAAALASVPFLAVGFGACDSTSMKKSGGDQSAGTVARLERTGTLLEADSVPFFSDPSTAVVTQADEIVFIDQSNSQVAVFDSTGRQTASLGRRGQGPGEFLSPQAIFSLHADTLAVFDRQKLAVTLIVRGNVQESTIDFQTWEFDVRDRLQLVGRFASRIPLDEIAPASAAICDSGVVVVDTSGIQVFDADGRRSSSLKLPVRRVNVAQLGNGVAGVVDRATFTIRDLPEQSEVGKLLLRMSEGVDSVLLRPTIDATGLVWFPRATERGGAWVRTSS